MRLQARGHRRGFITLISSLKGKVNSVKILKGPDADSCTEKVAQAIESSVGPIAISSQIITESGIKIELALQATVTTAVAPKQVNLRKIDEIDKKIESARDDLRKNEFAKQAVIKDLIKIQAKINDIIKSETNL